MRIADFIIGTLLLVLIYVSMCGLAQGQELEKGEYIDLTQCHIGNNNPICTGDPLPVKEEDRFEELERIMNPESIEEVKNVAISVPVPKYIGKGKYCYPLPLGDNQYKWECPKND